MSVESKFFNFTSYKLILHMRKHSDISLGFPKVFLMCFSVLNNNCSIYKKPTICSYSSISLPQKMLKESKKKP